MSRFSLVVTILCAAIAGCATVSQPTAEPSGGKEYVTGSRIPVRDGSTSRDVKTLDPSAIDQMRNPAGAGRGQ